MGARWTVILSPLAQNNLNAVRSVVPAVDLLFQALSSRLAHDPFLEAKDAGNGIYAIVLEPTSVINVTVRALYLVGDGKVLIKKLVFS